jgi:hypothetical protein
MKRDVSFDLPTGVAFKGVELPDSDTPLPPTNATLHVLEREDGYGTPDRKFTAICGTSWTAGSGGHKYFFSAETHWHKHINCSGCLMKIKEGQTCQ